MPLTSKSQGGVGLRTAGGSLPVLQLPGGQQSIQLLSLQQQQRGGQLKAGTLTAAIATSAQQAGGATRTGAGSSTAVPLSTVLTGPQMTALTNLAVGKGGGATTTTIPTQQFIQLTGPAQGGANPQGGSQTLHTQLFQKAGAGGQTLQFHQVQLKQGTTVMGPTLAPAGLAPSASKSKSKKRTGSTPPKSM